MRRRTQHRLGAWHLAGALTLAATGCGSPVTRFAHPGADFSFYESVGIVPFGSLGQDQLAGEKVSNVFFSELLAERFANVREPGQFAAVIQRVRGSGVSNLPWSAADLLRLGNEAQVQGVFMGVVRDYEMTGVGRSTFPLVSI